MRDLISAGHEVIRRFGVLRLPLPFAVACSGQGLLQIDETRSARILVVGSSLGAGAAVAAAGRRRGVAGGSFFGS